MLDQFIVSGGNFIQFVLASRYMAPDEVGKFAYTVGAGVFVYMLAYAWIYQNTMTSCASEKIGNFVLLNGWLCAVIIPALFFCFSYLFGKSDSLIETKEVLLCVAYVILGQCIDFSRRMAYFTDALFMKQPWHVSVIGMFPRLIAIWMIQPRSLIDFALVLVTFMFPGAMIYIIDAIRIRVKEFFSFFRRQIQHGGWLTLNIPLNWVWGQAPVYLVGMILGNELAGLFASVRSITNIGNFGLELIPTYFASRLSGLRSKDGGRGYMRSFLYALAAGGVIWCAVFLLLKCFGAQVLVLVLGERFRPHVDLLLLLWMFILILFLTRLLFLHLRFIERTWVIPLANTVGVGALVLMFDFFHADGLIGMARAMLMAGIIVVVIMFTAARIAFPRAI